MPSIPMSTAPVIIMVMAAAGFYLLVEHQMRPFHSVAIKRALARFAVSGYKYLIVCLWIYLCHKFRLPMPLIALLARISELRRPRVTPDQIAMALGNPRLYKGFPPFVQKPYDLLVEEKISAAEFINLTARYTPYALILARLPYISESQKPFVQAVIRALGTTLEENYRQTSLLRMFVYIYPAIVSVVLLIAAPLFATDTVYTTVNIILLGISLLLQYIARRILFA